MPGQDANDQKRVIVTFFLLGEREVTKEHLKAIFTSTGFWLAFVFGLFVDFVTSPLGVDDANSMLLRFVIWILPGSASFLILYFGTLLALIDLDRNLRIHEFLLWIVSVPPSVLLVNGASILAELGPSLMISQFMPYLLSSFFIIFVGTQIIVRFFWPDLNGPAQPAEALTASSDPLYFSIGAKEFDALFFNYVTAENQYVNLVSDEGSVILAGSLSRIQEQIPEDSFLRANRSVLIFSHAIEGIDLKDKTVKLKSGEVFPISKRMFSAFGTKFESLSRNKP